MRTTVSRAAWWAALVAAVAALGGCSDNITGDAEQVGPRSPNFELAPATARGVATGQHRIDAYEVQVDLSSLAPDAFQRSGSSGAKIGYGSPACSASGLGGVRCFNLAAWVRDSAGDPRRPAMKATPSRLTVSWFEMGGPEYFGANAGVRAFEIYARLGGLRPSTPHYMSLVRYGLVVRGALDAVEKLVTGRVTEPDSLVVLSPNPAGDPTTNYNWVTNLGCNNNPTPAGANPFLLGPSTANSAGTVTFDKCFASGSIFYRNATAVVPDSAPFFLNSLNAPKIAQQYNYIEISEGSSPGGPVVARIQVGADIDPTTGNAIPNSFAPFPAAALSPGTLIGQLKIAQGGPSAVRMTALPLEQLQQGASYAIMLVNRETGTASQVSARYWTMTIDTTGRNEQGEITTDTTFSDTTVVDAISGGPANVTHFIEVTDALNSAGVVRAHTDLGLQPPAATGGVPVWVNYMRQNGTPANTQDDTFFDTGATRMGTLPIAVNATPYVFAPAGFGSGTNRGDEIGIIFQHLPRPPIGFFYNVWLIPTAEGGAPLSLGELRTPLPELASLRDADVAEQIGGVLTRTEILRAAVLLRPQDVTALNVDLSDYSTIRLTLEAKDGVPAIAPIVVLEGGFVTP